MTPGAVALAVAYLSGSIPTAYLAGRVVKNIDLRTVGSGNLGATNVFRTLGWKVALVVFLVDVLKGMLPVLLLPGLVMASTQAGNASLWFALACGVAAIVGHAKPIFLLWRGGGKGVATAAGMFLALAPIPLGVALVVFAAVLWVTGYVSAGSLSAAVALVATLVWSRGAASPVTLAAVAIAGFVFWSHRANIQRLRAGTEHRFATRGRTGDAT